MLDVVSCDIIDNELLSLLRIAMRNDYIGGADSEMEAEYEVQRVIDDHEGGDFIKAYLNGELVGFAVPDQVSAVVANMFKEHIDTDYWRPGIIYVRADVREMGVGKAIVAKCQELHTNLFWMCDKSNHSSANLALSSGFERIESLSGKEKYVGYKFEGNAGENNRCLF